jgi:hypothetical protein
MIISTGSLVPSSAEHGNITHDEMSALLIVLKLPEGPDTLTASEYASVQRFEEMAGARHRMPAATALEGIIPTA